MTRIFLRSLFFAAFFFFCCLSPNTVKAEQLKFTSSTQFIWGDDILGESQAIVAQYLRFSMTPEAKKYSLAGYGRIWQDLGQAAVRDDDFSARLYYLFLDYQLLDNASFRIGRQFVNLTAGSSIMDGVSLNVTKLGPVGILVSGGRDVKFSLDSEHTRNGNYFAGIDIHLDSIKSLQLGISYVMKFDESDRAREEFGMNFRYFYKSVSPYAEVRYDRLSETIDEAVAGIDFFPISNLFLKGEFYHSYPTFDSTSIYSVFAVDKYQEFLLRAEYSFEAPFTVYSSYVRQTYEDSEEADLFTVGARVFPTDRLTVNASIDYRNGYGGNTWGFEVSGDYRLKDKFLLAAGVQHDSYRRPDFSDENYDDAQRYWVGGKWLINDHMNVTARIEDNVNANFDHRTLGRVALNWSL